MRPRSSGENGNSLEEEAYDEAIGVIPKTMTNPESTDYAALIRAVTPNSERKHPEWLDSGQQLPSPHSGQGQRSDAPLLRSTGANPGSTDYAALIRAVTPNSERKHPEWLDSGQQLFSPQYGQGKVMSWMGNTLIVKFPGYSVPVLYKDWQQAVERSEIAPGEASKSSEE